MFAGAVRHPRATLIGTVAVMSAVVGLGSRLHGAGHALLAVLVSLLALLLVAVAVVAHFRPRQAAFVIDPRTPAFHTPRHETQLFMAIAIVAFGAEAVLFRSSGPRPAPAGGLVHRLMHLEDATLTFLTALLVVLAAANVVLAWRGAGAQLRPDGVVDRTGVGALMVPWEAFAPDHPVLPPPPKATRLVLTLARPELARRRGLAFSSSVQANNVDPVFLAHAIRCYVANPDRRPSIGTRAEYERLLRPSVNL
jgi:hypothetical protein